ncbi:MAG: sugar transporter [Oxalobacter formigenes]|nr:sugar transporter [Oxalobacter formigenes]
MPEQQADQPLVPLSRKDTGYTLKSHLHAWLPALSLSFSAFIFVSTEFMPVGLLPDMAASLNRSQPEMGTIMTFYAWTVALMSLPLTIASARCERKRLLLGVLLVFIAGNAMAAFASSFSMLLIARIGIALAHAIFWSIAVPLAYRVAPQGKQPQALGLVVAGAALAVVLGVPLGTAIGHSFGWRWAFAAVSIIALPVFAVMWLTLPMLPSANAGSLKSLPVLFHRPPLIVAYILTAMVVCGHFAAYTYLTPYLESIGQFSPQLVVVILLIMGGAGVIGSIVLSHTTGKYPVVMFYLPVILVGLSLLMLESAASNLFSVCTLCFIWGAAMTGVGLVLQSKILKFAHDATDVATSIYSGIYNIGIGGGALIGGQVYNRYGLSRIGYAGLFFIAAALALVLLLRYARKKEINALETL